VEWTCIYCRSYALNQIGLHPLTWHRCGAFRPESEQLLFKGVVVCPSQVSLHVPCTLLFRHPVSVCEQISIWDVMKEDIIKKMVPDTVKDEWKICPMVCPKIRVASYFPKQKRAHLYYHLKLRLKKRLGTTFKLCKPEKWLTCSL